MDHTEWFGVTAFGRLAERPTSGCSEGSRVYVEGRLESRTWDSPEGRRFFLDVIANEVVPLDPRERGTASARRCRCRHAMPAVCPPTRRDTLDDVPF